MQNFTLPGSDISLFPVTLGTVGVGEKIGREAAFSLFDAYRDMGGNVLDTARVYTGGESERVIGEYFASSGRRSELVLITKGGHPMLDTMHAPRMTEADMRSDIEKSLHALQTDYIDLYFFHRDDLSQPVEESVGIMEKFVAEGKIRAYGCSNWTTERMRQAQSYCAQHGLQGFAANQALYNIGSDHMKPFADDTMCTMDAEMKRFHKESDILSMPYFGVCSGFFHALKNKGEESVKNSPYYTEKDLEIAGHIYALAERYGVTITQVLLGFFFAQPFPNCPLYGPSRPAQLAELAGIRELPFDSKDFDFAL